MYIKSSMELEASVVRQRVISPVLEKAFHDSYPDEIPHNERLGRDAYLLRQHIQVVYFSRLEVLMELGQTTIGIKSYLHAHPIVPEGRIIFVIQKPNSDPLWLIGTRGEKEEQFFTREMVDHIIELMRSSKAKTSL